MKPAILVLGATGTIGRATVRAAVEAGWPVVAVARDAAALEELHRRHPQAALQTVVGSVADDVAAEALVAALQKLERAFTGVIAALGAGRERGRLLDQPAGTLGRTFDDAVLPHLVAARHLLPWLAASGRNCGYVVVGGPGSRHPWAGYGHRSVAAAAVRMLARVLHGEARAFAVRLQLLDVESPVRTAANEQHACRQWPCADDIGRKALALLEHRNDARCPEAVVGYRDDACFATPRDVEAPTAHSSSPEEATSDPTRTPPLPAPPQELDSGASLLPSRCLQDVRKLLETFTPTKKNQEQTK